MPAKWTGDYIKKLHLNGLSQNDVARKLGVSKVRVSTVLNAEKTTPEQKERYLAVLDELIQEVKNERRQSKATH